VKGEQGRIAVIAVIARDRRDRKPKSYRWSTASRDRWRWLHWLQKIRKGIYRNGREGRNGGKTNHGVTEIFLIGMNPCDQCKSVIRFWSAIIRANPR